MSILKEHFCGSITVFKNQSLYHDFGLFSPINLTLWNMYMRWSWCMQALTKLKAQYTPDRTIQNQMHRKTKYKVILIKKNVPQLLIFCFLPGLTIWNCKKLPLTFYHEKIKSVVVNANLWGWWNPFKVFMQNVIDCTKWFLMARF